MRFLTRKKPARSLDGATDKPAEITVSIDLGQGRRQEITGQGVDSGDFRLLVESQLDFSETQAKITAWWRELPAVLQRESIDIMVVAHIATPEHRDGGGQANLRLRSIILAGKSKGALHYFFLHEMSHLIIDMSTRFRSARGLSMAKDWRAIAKRDRLETAPLAEAGVICLRFCASDDMQMQESGEGFECEMPTPVDIAIGTDYITRYAEKSPSNVAWMEDIAESLALHLLAEVQGGLDIQICQFADGTNSRVSFENKQGEKILCPFSNYFPHREKVLEALCAWTPTQGEKKAWSEILAPILREGIHLRLEEHRLRHQGKPIPALTTWNISQDEPVVSSS